MSGPVSDLLVSADDGPTFSQMAPPTLFGQWSSAFLTGAQGVVVGNAGDSSSDAVYYTTDGGASWSESTLGLGPSTGLLTITAPVVDGSDILIGVSQGHSGSRSIHLLISDDGGETFTTADTLGTSVSDPSPPLLGVDGRAIWFGSDTGGSLGTSDDDGATWANTTPVGIVRSDSSSVQSLDPSSGRSGSAWVMTGCPSKSGCPPSGRATLTATTDGGEDWTAVADRQRS